MAKAIGRASKRTYTVLGASSEGVPDRWHKQYPDSKKEIGAALERLGDDADPNETAAAIGNKSWTHPYCGCCYEYADVAVEVGDDPTTVLCVPCLNFLAKAAKSAVNGDD